MQNNTTLKKSLQNPWFDWIQSGIKKYEGRLFKGDWASLKIDDIVIFVCPENRELPVRVVDLVRFNTFGDAFDALGSELVPIPNVSTLDVVNLYAEYFKDEDIAQYGVVAIKVEPVDSA